MLTNTFAFENKQLNPYYSTSRSPTNGSSSETPASMSCTKLTRWRFIGLYLIPDFAGYPGIKSQTRDYLCGGRIVFTTNTHATRMSRSTYVYTRRGRTVEHRKSVSRGFYVRYHRLTSIKHWRIREFSSVASKPFLRRSSYGYIKKKKQTLAVLVTFTLRRCLKTKVLSRYEYRDRTICTREKRRVVKNV